RIVSIACTSKMPASTPALWSASASTASKPFESRGTAWPRVTRSYAGIGYEPVYLCRRASARRGPGGSGLRQPGFGSDRRAGRKRALSGHCRDIDERAGLHRLPALGASLPPLAGGRLG